MTDTVTSMPSAGLISSEAGFLSPSEGAKLVNPAEGFCLNDSLEVKRVHRPGIGSHQGPMAKDEWLTPPEIIKALGSFDLDPCSPIDRPWPTAERHLTIHDDGLAVPWWGRVWLNPPYGPFTGEWMKKLSEHRNGIALIFARTETEAWFSHIWPRASAVLFLQGRLHFHHVNGRRAKANAGAPSALIAYGSENENALRESGLPGKIITL